MSVGNCLPEISCVSAALVTISAQASPLKYMNVFGKPEVCPSSPEKCDGIQLAVRTASSRPSHSLWLPGKQHKGKQRKPKSTETTHTRCINKSGQIEGSPHSIHTTSCS